MTNSIGINAGVLSNIISKEKGIKINIKLYPKKNTTLFSVSTKKRVLRVCNDERYTNTIIANVNSDVCRGKKLEKIMYIKNHRCIELDKIFYLIERQCSKK